MKHKIILEDYMKKIMTLLLCILCISCTVAPKVAYEGLRLKQSQDAVLLVEGKHSTVGFNKKMFIKQVDEMSLRDIKAMLTGQMFPYPHKVFVLPGKHTISVVTAVSMGHATAELWFVAEAGKTYIVRSNSNGDTVSTWIEDGDSGVRVGGLSTPL